MESEISVSGKIAGIQPPGHFDEEPEDGALVRIAFFLKDKLKVTGEGAESSEVKMKQCCYELKFIAMRIAEIEDANDLKEEVKRVLRNELKMDPEAARKALPKVTKTILETVRSFNANNTSFWTILLEVHIDCQMKRSGVRAGAPFGEHGFARLKERIADGAECSICHDEFEEDKDIVVTTCHHVFDRPCISDWLDGAIKTCPNCRADLAPMGGGRILFRS